MWSCDCVGEVSVHAVGGHLPVAGPGRVGQDGVSGDACLRVQVLQEIALCAKQGVAPHVLARRPGGIGDQQHPVPWLGFARVMIRRILAPSSWAFLATSPPTRGTGG